MKNAILIVIAFALGAGRCGISPGGKRRAPLPQARRPARRGGFGGGGGRPQAQPPLVIVERVKHDQLFDAVEALGTTQANESVTLSAKVTDTVRSVNFEDGDYVEAGHVLIELTNQEESALLAEARANLDDAEKSIAPVTDLSARGLASIPSSMPRDLAPRRRKHGSTPSSPACATG